MGVGFKSPLKKFRFFRSTKFRQSKGKRKLPLSSFHLFCQSSINVNQMGKESYRFNYPVFASIVVSSIINQRKKATAFTLPCFSRARVCVSSKWKRKLPLSVSLLCPSCCFVNRQSKEESYRFQHSALSVHANQREKKATAFHLPFFHSCYFVNQRKKKATAFNCFSITMSYYGSTKVFKLRFARFQTLYVNYIFF